MTTADVSNPDEVEALGRALKQEQKIWKRAVKTAELRGRILSSLIMLSRYEQRYEIVLAMLEDRWRGS